MTEPMNPAQIAAMVAKLRGVRRAWAGLGTVGDPMCQKAADLIEAQAAEIARLTKSRDEWRENFRTLECAIVGDTGLSAMLIAIQAKLFRPRAEAAEAKVAAMTDALHTISGDMQINRDGDEELSDAAHVARSALEKAL